MFYTNMAFVTGILSHDKKNVTNGIVSLMEFSRRRTDLCVYVQIHPPLLLVQGTDNTDQSAYSEMMYKCMYASTEHFYLIDPAYILMAFMRGIEEQYSNFPKVLLTTSLQLSER